MAIGATCTPSPPRPKAPCTSGHARQGRGLYLGAGAYVLAKAFASGGSAVTGVEAISNGVPAFREPAWKHARQTLVLMGSGSV